VPPGAVVDRWRYARPKAPREKLGSIPVLLDAKSLGIIVEINTIRKNQ
jgi:hypothetical protein